MSTHVEITLKSSWQELLGKDQNEIPESVRKERWQKWLELMAAKDSEYAAMWQNTENCDGCKHLNGSWCDSMGLPCTINPILTLRHGMIGMACCGAGYEAIETSCKASQ